MNWSGSYCFYADFCVLALKNEIIWYRATGNAEMCMREDKKSTLEGHRTGMSTGAC